MPRDAPRQDDRRSPFEDAVFDLCISQDLLAYAPDSARGLAEIYRMLAPGGRYVFTVPSSPQASPAPESDHTGHALVQTLQSTGFSVVVHEVLRDDVPGGHISVFELVKPN